VSVDAVVSPSHHTQHETEWEIEERWEDAREEVGGLLPGDWCYETNERGYSYADRCLAWLAHSEYVQSGPWLAPLPVCPRHR
jgi:hypothetical protein